MLYQKQVSRAGTNNYISQVLWDVIACPCPWYLLLAQHSWIHLSLIWKTKNSPILSFYWTDEINLMVARCLQLLSDNAMLYLYLLDNFLTGSLWQCYVVWLDLYNGRLRFRDVQEHTTEDGATGATCETHFIHSPLTLWVGFRYDTK